MALSDNLVSYYELENTSGDVIDSHGSNDGTNNGATRGVSGKINNAFDFDGTDDYVNIADDPSLDGMTAISFSAWIYPNDITSEQRIVAKDASGGRSFGFALKEGNKVYLGVFNSGGNVRNGWTTSYTLPSTNQWYHVVVVMETDDTMRAWVNGDEKTFTIDNDNSIDNIQDTNTAVTIGRRIYSGNEDYFDGKIDEVGIWDRALSSTEVSDLYNSGNGLSYSEITSTNATYTATALSLSTSSLSPDDVIDDSVSVSVLSLSTTDEEPTYKINVSSLNLGSTLKFKDALLHTIINNAYPFRPAQSIGTAEIRKDRWTYKGITYGTG